MFRKILSVEWLLVILAIATLLMPSARCNPNYDGADTFSILPSNDSPMPNDSLPHYIYQQVADSISRIEQKNERISRSNGSLLSFFSIGYSKLNDESIGNIGPALAINDSYYLSLGNYWLEEDARFKVQGKQWLIDTHVWDSVRKRNDGNYRYGHYVLKPVKVRFATDLDDRFPNVGRVLIPVSHQKFRLLNIILWFLYFVAGGFGIYAVLITPAAIFLRIANGNSFSQRNYGGLYITGWTLIGCALLPVILGLIMQFVFHRLIPPEIHYSAYENLLPSKGILLGGLLTLLLARAFQKGYEIQLDNNSIV